MKVLPSRKLFRVARFLLIAACVCGMALGLNFYFFQNNDPLYIAILAPEDSASGEEMIRGAKMYIQEVNDSKEGGIDGRQIKLKVFDDESEVETGRNQAKEIADGQFLLTLGSYSSSVSIAAGKVFQEHDLPAITAISEAGEVTKGNDVYFRATFTTSDQGSFLASYLNKILGREAATVIYNQRDDFSESLASSFWNNFQGLGGQINHTIDIKDYYTEEGEFQPLALFNQKLLTIEPDNIGTVVLLTRAKEAADIVANLKRAGIDAPIIGGTPLFEKTFREEIDKYPETQAKPGYFFDGIYATSPLIYDIAGEETQAFKKKYREFVDDGKEPSWIGAMSYESAKIAVEALKEAKVAQTPEKDIKDIQEKRKAVLQALLQMRSVDRGVRGLDRNLYFNRDRNLPRAIAMGVYEKQEFISAPIQLQPIHNAEAIDRLNAKVEDGEILRFDGKYAHVTKVVYTGIDINEISRLDLKRKRYIADFFLWFRYRDDGDQNSNDNEKPNLQDIEFLNSEKTIELDNPIDEIDEGDSRIKVRTFRVKTRFQGDFDFRDYPFDVQQLTVKFRHANLTRKNIIYAADNVGMNNSDLSEKIDRGGVLETLDTWEFKDAKFFESVSKNYSSLGNVDKVGLNDGIQYSQFNAIIEIKRNSSTFSINKLLPLGFFIWILYLYLFFPLGNFSAETVGGILLGVVFFHIGLKSELAVASITTLDKIFYIIYGLIATQVVLVTTVVKFRDREKSQKRLKLLVHGFRFAFPLYLFLANFMVLQNYNLLPVDNGTQTFQEETAPKDLNEGVSPEQQTTLTLANWHPMDKGKFQELFEAYYQNHPNIKIETLSTPYNLYGESIKAQFQQGTAPDLVFLRSYDLDRDLFYQGYLTSFDKNNWPALEKTYPQKFLSAWTTKKGDIYGIPLSGVVHGIFYNADLFRQLGLSVPQTWEQLLNVAQVIQNTGTTPFANSIGNISQSFDETLFTTLVPNFTGGYTGRLAYQGGSRCFNDEGIVATFRAISQLQPYLDEENLSNFQSIKRFLNGQAAMWIGGSWNLPNFTQQDIDFQWQTFAVPPPAGRKGYTVFHPNFAVGLNAQSPHKQEAKEFLRWLMTPEAAKILTTKLEGNFALHKQMPDIENTKAQRFYSFVQERDTDVRWTYPELHEKIPGGHTLTKEASKKVLSGDMTPQEAANHLQEGLGEWYTSAQTCKD